MAFRSSASAASLVAIAAAAAFGSAPPQLGWRIDGDPFLRIGEGIETPHTAWANPCAAGPLKVLFLADRSAAYDVPELARRLALDARGMPAETWFRLGHWYWLWIWLESSTGSERAAHFESLLDLEHLDRGDRVGRDDDDYDA
ncbi:MAG: hypothetical protein JXP34_10665, partial [Planctomycetes bacterium]|nr:hypothetical protein [Planctomycetota bacterium]